MIGGKIKNGWDLSFERSHPLFLSGLFEKVVFTPGTCLHKMK